MTKERPLSAAYGNQDPVARDLSHNYAASMCRTTMQKVAAAMAAQHQTFRGWLGRMVAPAFARAASPPRTRSSGTRGMDFRIDT